jgi:hypothetical protein
MWPARRGRPRYIGGLALTRLAAWLAVHRRQLLQRAEYDARGRRRCAEDETMTTTTALSRRQLGATRRAGNFLAVSRAFLSFGVSERASEGRGWPRLAGWMKAQIRAKTRIQDTTRLIFAIRMKKKRVPRASPDSWLEMLLPSVDQIVMIHADTQTSADLATYIVCRTCPTRIVRIDSTAYQSRTPRCPNRNGKADRTSS